MTADPVFIVGFTGTRHGMNRRQKDGVRERLGGWFRTGAEFHFGDCVGSDEEAFQMAKQAGYRTVAHPPSSPLLRAFCQADQVLPPAPYIIRNRAIVERSRRLLATPNGPEILRSGTWATIRYARLLERPIAVFEP